MMQIYMKLIGKSITVFLYMKLIDESITVFYI
jgi:hypothetical protein